MRVAALALLFLAACAAPAAPPAAPVVTPAPVPEAAPAPSPTHEPAVQPPVEPRADLPAEPPPPEAAAPSTALRLHGGLGPPAIDPVAVGGSGTQPQVAGPSVELGEVRAPSGMSEVAGVVAGLRVGFKRCYSNALQSAPNAAGIVSLEVTVGADGVVTGVVANGGKGVSPDLVKCISRVLERVQFSRPPGGSATLGVPIMLGPR
jgi:hypothetical protein